MDVNDLNKRIESIAERMHLTTFENKKTCGFHHPRNCESDNAIRMRRPYPTPKMLYCDSCNFWMCPYQDLPDDIKETYRKKIRDVFNAALNIEKQEETVSEAKEFFHGLYMSGSAPEF